MRLRIPLLAAAPIAVALLAGCTGAQSEAATPASPTTSVTSAPRADPPEGTAPSTTTSGALAPWATIALQKRSLEGLKVTVVGDSLTDGVALRFEQMAKDRGMVVHLDAEVGRQIPAGIPALKKLAKGADLVVIALGTNDASKDAFNASTAPLLIQSALDAVPPDVPVLWVDVYRDPGTWARDRADIFNRALDDAARNDPRLTVIRWTDFVADHPSWIAADRVHLTDGGYAGRALWLMAVVEDALQSPRRR